MLSMHLHVHTCTADSIPGVSWPTGARVASWSVAAVGVSATTSVVRGTLIGICIITDITVNLTIFASKTLQLPVSFTPCSKSTSFTIPSQHRLSCGLRTDDTDFMTRSFLLSISIFLFLLPSLLFCLVPCGRASWLFVSILPHADVPYRIVSYRVVA